MTTKKAIRDREIGWLFPSVFQKGVCSVLDDTNRHKHHTIPREKDNQIPYAHMCAYEKLVPFTKKCGILKEAKTERRVLMDWKRKLTSRKLWLSIASFVSMLLIYFGHAESEASQIAALIMAGATIIGYVIGEGLADSSNNTDNKDEEF